ncbi:MAG: NAD-dependent deacylase [Pseudomonadota bacterium]
MDQADSIVILTGAGISKESGLATFRDKDGIWARHRIEDVATPQAFQSNPERVHNFYNARRAGLYEPSIAPNPAHDALVDLEKRWEGDFLLVTQNVDNLHQRAGSQSLIAMHGSLSDARCVLCNYVTPWRENLDTETECPNCGKTGGMRPDVVWFGEMPREMDQIIERLESTALFIAIGTSATVYPAAGFVEIAGRAGAMTIEANLEASQASDLFDETILGPAAQTTPELVDRLLNPS